MDGTRGIPQRNKLYTNISHHLAAFAQNSKLASCASLMQHLPIRRATSSKPKPSGHQR
jgi:hypothetical protein